jgi:Right handed beta helix region
LTRRSVQAAIVLAIASAFLALPAVAAAKTWVVGVTENVTPDVGCEGSSGEGSSTECDLWEAIDLANFTAGKDTIEFEVPEVIVESSLPEITEAVTIDGRDPEGEPGVEIRWAGEGFIDAFRVAGEESLITGLAITGFSDGITLLGTKNRLCRNYIGTGLDGETAAPNEVGIFVAVESVGSQIGAGCAAGTGNLISGNDWVGVLDRGDGTEIRRNLIGTDAAGSGEIPNGEHPSPSAPSAGILVQSAVAKSRIGGTLAGQGNTIAFNADGVFGAGIVVFEGATATIRGNSVFDNKGLGIEYVLTTAPSIPAIEAVKSTETVSSVVTGTIAGAAAETIELDFFANAACDAGGAGEGKTYLGSATTKVDSGGVGKFEASLPVQPKGTVLTATATTQAGHSSEFSTCFTAPQPDPAPLGPPAPPSPPAEKKDVPVNGETLAVAPVSGKIFVKRPGQKKPVPLKEGQTIPVGSIVDATNGKVTLTSINKAGEEQTAVFYGGKFLVVQKDGSGLVVLKLRGELSCAGTSATTSGKKGRKLWGSGHGNFRTEGNSGSATVRGTIWLTEDRCGGSTFFKVKRGVVSVRDFAAGKTISLPAGKSYLAQP